MDIKAAINTTVAIRMGNIAINRHISASRHNILFSKGKPDFTKSSQNTPRKIGSHIIKHINILAIKGNSKSTPYPKTYLKQIIKIIKNAIAIHKIINPLTIKYWDSSNKTFHLSGPDNDCLIKRIKLSIDLLYH